MTTMSEVSGFYTTIEAAEVIGVSPCQVTRYVKNKMLPAKRIGKQILLPQKQVDKFSRPPRGNPQFRKQ